MDTVSRWLAPAILAAGAGLAAMTPAPVLARDDDELVRVIVDVADVVLRGGVPYYRYGQYGYDDRLIVGRDRRGRPMYYRHLPRREYGRFYDGGRAREVKCNRNGRCTVVYYDPRYDRRYDRRYDNRHYRYDDRFYRHGDRQYRYGDRRW